MTLTCLVRIASVVGVSVCLTATSAFAATPLAVDPPGAVSLSAGESVPARTKIVGASDEWVAYGSGPSFYTQTYHATSLRDGHTVDLGGFGDLPHLTGSMVVVPHVDQLDWTDLDTGETGTALFPEGRFAGATPTGWLLLAGPTGAAFVDARSGAVTPVGLPPHSQVIAGEVRLGPSGVLLRPKLSYTPVYVTFASPDVVRPLPASCSFVGAIDLGCGGYDDVRIIPLDGSPILSWPVAKPAYWVAVTATRVGWTDNVGLLHTSDKNGQSRLDSSAPIDVQAATSAGFLYVGGSSAADAGIYLIPDVCATPQQVVALGAGVLRADTIALGPGRVAWIDNASASRALWSTDLDAHGARVDVVPRQLLATPPSPWPPGGIHSADFLAVSGRRTVYGSYYDLFLDDAGRTTTVVHSADGSIAAAQLSGTRLLVTRGLVTSIIDVRTRAVLSADRGLLSPVLRGDYLVYVKSNGAIVRRNLVTGVLTEVRPAQRGTAVPENLTVHGDYVAWTLAGFAMYRNVRARSAIVRLPTNEFLVGLAGDGIVTKRWAGQAPWPLIFRRYGARVSTTIATNNPSVTAVIDGNVIAWIDQDGLPKVATLPGGSGRAQLLGSAATPRATTASHTWTGEWDASSTLTSCEVRFISGRTTVRTVACDAAAMAVGVATTTWDGLNAAGTRVSGRIAWRLVASNQAGAVLREDGALARITGTLTAR